MVQFSRRHHEPAAGLLACDCGERLGIHVVGMPVRAEHEVEPAEVCPADLVEGDRRRHKPLMGEFPAAVFRGQRVRKIRIDQDHSPRSLHNEAGLPEPAEVERTIEGPGTTNQRTRASRQTVDSSLAGCHHATGLPAAMATAARARAAISVNSPACSSAGFASHVPPTATTASQAR